MEDKRTMGKQREEGEEEISRRERKRIMNNTILTAIHRPIVRRMSLQKIRIRVCTAFSRVPFRFLNMTLWHRTKACALYHAALGAGGTTFFVRFVMRNCASSVRFFFLFFSSFLRYGNTISRRCCLGKTNRRWAYREFYLLALDFASGGRNGCVLYILQVEGGCGVPPDAM